MSREAGATISAVCRAGWCWQSLSGAGTASSVSGLVWLEVRRVVRASALREAGAAARMSRWLYGDAGIVSLKLVQLAECRRGRVTGRVSLGMVLLAECRWGLFCWQSVTRASAVGRVSLMLVLLADCRWG